MDRSRGQYLDPYAPYDPTGYGVPSVSRNYLQSPSSGVQYVVARQTTADPQATRNPVPLSAPDYAWNNKMPIKPSASDYYGVQRTQPGIGAPGTDYYIQGVPGYADVPPANNRQPAPVEYRYIQHPGPVPAAEVPMSRPGGDYYTKAVPTSRVAPAVNGSRPQVEYYYVPEPPTPGIARPTPADYYQAKGPTYGNKPAMAQYEYPSHPPQGTPQYPSHPPQGTPQYWMDPGSGYPRPGPTPVEAQLAQQFGAMRVVGAGDQRPVYVTRTTDADMWRPAGLLRADDCKRCSRK